MEEDWQTVESGAAGFYQPAGAREGLQLAAAS